MIGKPSEVKVAPVVKLPYKHPGRLIRRRWVEAARRPALITPRDHVCSAGAGTPSNRRPPNLVAIAWDPRPARDSAGYQAPTGEGSASRDSGGEDPSHARFLEGSVRPGSGEAGRHQGQG